MQEAALITPRCPQPPRPHLARGCLRRPRPSHTCPTPAPHFVQVWNQLRKKPLSSLPDAHGPLARAAHGGASAGCATTLNPATGAEVVADVAGWVQSVAVCRNTDLVASGASDGSVRLWSLDKNKMGSAQGLSCIGGLPVSWKGG